MAAASLLLAMNMNCDGQWVRLQCLVFKLTHSVVHLFDITSVKALVMFLSGTVAHPVSQ